MGLMGLLEKLGRNLDNIEDGQPPEVWFAWAAACRSWAERLRTPEAVPSAEDAASESVRGLILRVAEKVEEAFEEGNPFARDAAADIRRLGDYPYTFAEVTAAIEAERAAHAAALARVTAELEEARRQNSELARALYDACQNATEGLKSIGDTIAKELEETRAELSRVTEERDRLAKDVAARENDIVENRRIYAEAVDGLTSRFNRAIEQRNEARAASESWRLAYLEWQRWATELATHPEGGLSGDRVMREELGAALDEMLEELAGYYAADSLPNSAAEARAWAERLRAHEGMPSAEELVDRLADDCAENAPAPGRPVRSAREVAHEACVTRKGGGCCEADHGYLHSVHCDVAEAAVFADRSAQVAPYLGAVVRFHPACEPARLWAQRWGRNVKLTDFSASDESFTVAPLRNQSKYRNWARGEAFWTAASPPPGKDPR
jgi:hypothetical protein